VPGTAGAAGSGGAPGTGGDAVDGGTCSVDTSRGPSLSIGSLYEWLPAYDGPALVERSANEGLTLTFRLADSTIAPGGAPDAGGPTDTGLYRHSYIGLDPTQLFPVGARVWFTKDADPAPPALEGDPGVPYSFAIHDGQGGRLIVGAALQGYGPLTAPITTSQPTPGCTMALQAGCITGTLTYGTTVVAGDTRVTVSTDAPATVTLGGVAYDVRYAAELEQGQVDSQACTNVTLTSMAQIDVRAHDLATLVASLPQGTLPTCVPGNDPDRTVSFYPLITGSVGNGVVSYLGPYSSSSDTFVFAASAGAVETQSPRLEIAGAQEVLPVPAVGQQFWYEDRQAVDPQTSLVLQQLDALFASEGGPLLLAQYFDEAYPTVPGPLSELTDLLGVDVTLEEACSYVGSVSLWDVVFATDPPVRVPSGTSRTIVLGGRSYNVWTPGGGTVTIYPAN
jgi:hypothetical protein